MYETLIPWFVIFAMRVFFLLLFLYSTTYGLIGVVSYIFSKNNEQKTSGFKKIKKGLFALLIGVGVIVVIVLIEQLIPRMWFGLSKPTSEYRF